MMKQQNFRPGFNIKTIALLEMLIKFNNKIDKELITSIKRLLKDKIL